MENDNTLHIGSRRELLVDDFLIDRLDNARLVLHHPQPAGTALRFDRPWEGAFSGYCTVMKDGNRVLLCYRGWPAANKENHRDAVTCVATSADGRTFERPDLGLYEVHGTKRNNVILTCDEDMYTHNFAPFIDSRPGVTADEKFKALTRNYGLAFLSERDDVMGLVPFASPDGIRWRRLSDAPIITQGKFDSQNVAFWSEHEQRYVCYLRETAGGDNYATGVRSVARCTSEDFLHWTPPRLMDMGDAPLDQLYTNQTHPYFRAPHIYIALPGRFMPGRQVLSRHEGERFGVHSKPGGKGGYWEDCSDAVLLTSRGGLRYDRTFMEAFIRPGLDRRNWTSRCNYPAQGTLQTGDTEMSLYVTRHNAQDGKYIERLRLRLDGFASLASGYDGGEMITRPLTFQGSRLELNYSTSAAGSIAIEIQSPDGQAVPGFALADSDPLIGDEIARTVTWKGAPNVGDLAARPVRLRFRLKDADLFSLRFHPHP